MIKIVVLSFLAICMTANILGRPRFNVRVRRRAWLHSKVPIERINEPNHAIALNRELPNFRLGPIRVVQRNIPQVIQRNHSTIRRASIRRLNNGKVIDSRSPKLIRKLDDDNAEEPAPVEENEPETEVKEKLEEEPAEEEQSNKAEENENQDQVIGESKEEQSNQDLQEENPQEVIKKEKKHFSTFKRLMHIASIINTFYAFIAKQIPEYKEDMTREEIFNSQMNTLQDSKNFLWVILYEYTQLKHEVDEFFADIEDMELSADEVLEFYGYNNFYSHIRGTQNVETKIFSLLEDRMLNLSNNFADKMRKMLTAVYYLRHIDQFLYQEIRPYVKDYTREGALENDVEKIEQGKKMLKVYLGIKDKIDGYIVDIKEGIAAGQKTNVEILWILKNMNNLSLMTPEEIEALAESLGNSSWLIRGLAAMVLMVLALFC